MATPLDVIHLDRVGSTQDEAASRFSDDPLLVTASGQDAGRGRFGAGWLDADRALAATLAFRPGWDPEGFPLITLIAGLAVLDVLPERVSLDWPNDVMVGDDKAGGILTEADDGLVRVGLGLNVHWASPPPGMTALHDEDPGVRHARSVAERWAIALLARVERGPDDWGREEYVPRCRTLGRDVTWEPGGLGRATGIAADGALVVDTGGAAIALHAGEVRRVRPRGEER